MISRKDVPVWASTVALAAAIAVTGCSTARETPPPPIGPKPQQSGLSLAIPTTLPQLDVGLDKPPLAVGDVFVYDNPASQWAVTSIDGPFIAWADDTGAVQQTSWSTLLPPLRWTGDDSIMNAGQRRISQLQGKLFPLKKGNRISYYEEVVYARPGASQNGFWQCDVGDQSDIVVPAGKAKVWEILCLLNGQEKRVMYYSEQIGHVVRFADTTESGLVIRQLIRYVRGRPPLASPTTASPTTAE